MFVLQNPLSLQVSTDLTSTSARIQIAHHKNVYYLLSKRLLSAFLYPPHPQQHLPQEHRPFFIRHPQQHLSQYLSVYSANVRDENVFFSNRYINVVVSKISGIFGHAENCFFTGTPRLVISALFIEQISQDGDIPNMTPVAYNACVRVCACFLLWLHGVRKFRNLWTGPKIPEFSDWFILGEKKKHS